MADETTHLWEPSTEGDHCIFGRSRIDGTRIRVATFARRADRDLAVTARDLLSSLREAVAEIEKLRAGLPTPDVARVLNTAKATLAQAEGRS